MVERITASVLSKLLKAAGDPTRRGILMLLAQNGPMGVTEIHGQFEMSLNSISKHNKVLESAVLVLWRTDWREHLIEVQLAPLSEIEMWFTELRSIWGLRLEALDTLITKGDHKDD